MIALVARDDLLLLRPVECIVVKPHELDHVVVCFGTRVGKPNFRHRHRRQRQQLFRQVDSRHVRAVEKGVVGRQLAHLRDCCIDQTFVAEPERCAPKTGHTFDVFVALQVLDVDTIPFIQNERTVFLVFPRIGHGMENGRDIACVRRIDDCGHS